MTVLDVTLWRPDTIAMAEALATLVVLGLVYDVVMLHPQAFDALAVVASTAQPEVSLRADGDVVVLGARFRRDDDA